MITRDEYRAIASEVTELNELLKQIPAEAAIERIGLEERLAAASKLISEIREHNLAPKAKLTFRGSPVIGSHSIAADFAGKAANAFTDAVTAIAAGMSIRYMGPIADKSKNQLFITGTAIGSFGFEFELPPPEKETLFAQKTKMEEALEKVQELFKLAAEGSDDEVADLVEEIHPRAVKKVGEFLDVLVQKDAWCGLEFKDKTFRYTNINEIIRSADRLKDNNINEKDESYFGEFQGVLPKSRTFEFKISGEKDVIRGSLGPRITDPDVINRALMHKPMSVEFHVITVGQGRPRFTLDKLPTEPKASDTLQQ